MPTSEVSTSISVRVVLAAALSGVAAFTTASAQSPAPNTPPQLRSLVDSSFTVTIDRLDPGRTVTRNFTPNPAPAPGVMSLNGEWPLAVVSGGEGTVNRKIRAVLRSPFGQVVADGCGYSRGAKPTSAGATVKPALSAAGQFQAGNQDGTSAWSVAVSYCDGFSPPPSGASHVLGDIEIHISYRAAR